MNELDKAYTQGFVDKCAVSGVDSGELFKSSGLEDKSNGRFSAGLSRNFRRVFGMKPKIQDYPEIYVNPADSAKQVATSIAPVAVGSAAFPLLRGKAIPEDMLAGMRGDHPSPSATLSKLMKSMGVKGVTVGSNEFLQSAYYPNEKYINIRKQLGKQRMGTLAHELGHAAGKTMPGYLGSPLTRNLPLLGMMGSALSQNEDVAAASGVLGSAVTIPTLAEELRASIRGARGLKNMKLPGRLGAFAGVGTYGAVSSLPILTYLLRKRRGQFEPAYQAQRKQFFDDSISSAKRRR